MKITEFCSGERILEGKITNLYDMLTFYADRWYLIGSYLGESSERSISDFKSSGVSDVTLYQLHSSGNESTAQKFIDNERKILEPLNATCQSIGLKFSSKKITSLLASLTTDSTLSIVEIINQEKEISERIKDELGECRVLLLEKEEKKLYEEEFPFGRNVGEAFLEEYHDIWEATKCLALERHTACVFHLTRALEGLVRRLGSKLRLNVKDRNGRKISVKNAMWNDILVSAESKIKEERKKKLRPERKKKLDEYEWLIHQLDHIRNAWRNPVSHGEFYEPSEARNIYELTRNFAQKLVTVL